MIRLEHVSVGYRDKIILSDLNFSFPLGQVTALIGPNGCGKSTVLKSVLGLIPKLGGKIFLDDRIQSELGAKEMAKRVAYLPQNRPDANILARRLVLHGRFPYLAFPRHYRPEDHDAVEQALVRADAMDIADCYMSELSGGQRQKIYLAMALSQKTPYILMDEPSTWLDIRHQLDLLRMSKALAEEGKAVVLVSHELCQTLAIADQVILLDKGQAKFVGNSQNLYESGLMDEAFGIQIHCAEIAGRRRFFVNEV